ncbi:MAG: hypothetical protein AAFU60_11815, partial [Bacteroidota bacterium]
GNELSIVASQSSKAAPNVFLIPTSSSGLLSEFELYELPSGDPVPIDQGIFQLGDIDTNVVQSYQLVALNQSCDSEVLFLNLGWNCSALTDVNEEPCFSNTSILTAVSPDGEIDMEVSGPDSCAALCDTVPYHTIEIFNADFGAVCDLILEADLEVGFSYLEGSTQVSYPAGSPFEAFPDPIDLGNGTLQWQLGALQDSLAENCLRGISLDPLNRIQVRFLGLTDCDFTAFSELSFRATGQQNCGTPTNIISRIGNPICIDLDVAVSETFFNVNLEDPVICGDSATLNVAFLGDGISSDTDTLTITLPPGIHYIPGTLDPLQNWQPGEPLIGDVFGQEQLIWGIPANVPALDVFSFVIAINGFASRPCGTEVLEVRTTTQSEAECALDGSICSVAVQTGNAQVPLDIDRPQYVFNSLQGFVNWDGVNSILSYAGVVENIGPDQQQATILELYWDLDQNGTWSPADSLLQTNTLPPANDPINFSGSISLPEEASICEVYWLIDSTNHCL